MPGETGSIMAKVDTAGRKGITAKTVKIRSNDPLRPLVVLVLKAEIKMPEGQASVSGQGHP
jgi:hypothetical protein